MTRGYRKYLTLVEYHHDLYYDYRTNSYSAIMQEMSFAGYVESSLSARRGEKCIEMGLFTNIISLLPSKAS